MENIEIDAACLRGTCAETEDATGYYCEDASDSFGQVSEALALKQRMQPEGT